MKRKKKYPESVSRAGLKLGRGWTESLIDKFLPTPDAYVDNPHYKCAAQMQLFHLKRVVAVEKTKRFIKAKEKSEHRKRAAAKSVETKLEKTRQWISNIQVTVPKLAKSVLEIWACRNYNEIQSWRESNGRKTSGSYADETNSSPEFLHRICVNYLRHCETEYEQLLDAKFGMTGSSECYLEIRRKVLRKIAEVYPWLAEECKKQDYLEEPTQRGDNAGSATVQPETPNSGIRESVVV